MLQPDADDLRIPGHNHILGRHPAIWWHPANE